MKSISNSKHLTLLLLVIIAIWPLNSSYGSQPKSLVPLTCEIEPLEYDQISGKLTVEVKVSRTKRNWPSCKCDMVAVRVDSVDGLEYTGNEEWDVYVDSITPSTTVLELTVPVNDTSGFIINATCGVFTFDWDRYFITTDDTVRAVWSNPRYYIPIGNPVSDEEFGRLTYDEYKKIEKARLEEIEQLKNYKGKSTTGHGPRLSPKDSVYYNTLSEHDQRLWIRMRNMERMPLTDKDQQDLSINGKWYRRYKGETKFQVIQGKTKEQIFADGMRYQDSLRANPPDNVYDVILDLRDPDDYEFIYKLVDSLIPKEENGFYRVLTTKAVMEKILERSIGNKRTNPPSWKKPDSYKPKPEPEKKQESRIPQRENKDILFFEGFEDAWPGIWSVLVGGKRPRLPL